MCHSHNYRGYSVACKNDIQVYKTIIYEARLLPFPYRGKVANVLLLDSFFIMYSLAIHFISRLSVVIS